MSAKIQTLENMSEEVKTAYIKALVVQALTDRQLDPREIADIYRLMAQNDLGLLSREAIRKVLAAQNIQLAESVNEIMNQVQGQDKEIIRFSLIKDFVRISKTDGIVVQDEQNSIRAIATGFYGDKASSVISCAEDVIKQDAAVLKGDVSISELEKRGKQIAAQASSIGVPLVAVYFSGSVVGLSAAGITSGLAALGFGGILGLSSMVTGIGVVVVAGVATYHAARWVLGGHEREHQAEHESMIQSVIKMNQQAIAALAEDIQSMATQMEEYMAKSTQNAGMLSALKNELAIFQAALSDLRNRDVQNAA